MAAEAKPSRNTQEHALVDRSRPAFRTMYSHGHEQPAARVKRGYGAASMRSSKTQPPTLTKSELDDIYSLGSDNDGQEHSKRRKMLKKAKTDVGVRAQSSYDNTTSKTPPPPPKTTARGKPAFRRTASEAASIAPAAPTTASTIAATSQNNPRRRLKSPEHTNTLSRSSVARALSDGALLRQVPRAPSPSQVEASPPARKARVGRVRLIDRLAAQVEESSDSDLDNAMNTMHSNPSTEPPATPQRERETPIKPSTQPAQSARRTNVKTYSQQRSMRAESGHGDALGSLRSVESDLAPTASLGKLDAFSFDEEEMEGVRPKGGILGLHALRQAGANHRFSNDLSDLFDRVGSPRSSDSASARSRRTALLELGRKLQEKQFVSQFCDDASKEVIFRHLGDEKDLVNGFVLVSALVVLLSNSAAPHVIEQVCRNGFEKMAVRMLDVDADIITLSQQRHANLSKHGQTSLKSLKDAITRSSSIWGSTTAPVILSPRTLALKALSYLSNDAISTSNTKVLMALVPSIFTIVDTGKVALQDNAEERSYLLDLELSLSLLQSISVAALEGDDGSQWMTRCLPSVAAILEVVVDAPTPEYLQVESQGLRLAMNTSNSASSAGIYGSDCLLRRLASVASKHFQSMHATVEQGKFPTDLYHRLVLVLGLLINITEHSPSSRERIGNWEMSTSPVGVLVATYLDHRESSRSVRCSTFLKQARTDRAKG